ncbi:Cys-tRNA(Pro) deacylase [Eggerthellaceae bacterium 3-80]
MTYEVTSHCDSTKENMSVSDMSKSHTEKKTNAIREVEASGLPFEVRYFECPEALSGVSVANLLGLDPDRVFKTLVTQGKSSQHYVFMVPVDCELDLKKAAAACGEKSIAMIKSKELLPLTGYIHGGCSPIGMNKLFPTYLDETAQLFDTITFSGGRLGCQLEMAPTDLLGLVNANYADLTVI